MGQMAGIPLATFRVWQRAGDHHSNGMRPVALTSTPLTAAAAVTFLLLSLFKLTIALSPQRYVMCKQMDSYQCLIWPVQIQDDGFDSTESQWTVDKRLVCFIVEFKSYPEDFKFIAVSIDGVSSLTSCEMLDRLSPYPIKKRSNPPTCIQQQFPLLVDTNVKQLSDGEEGRVFCRSISVVNPRNLPLPPIQDTNERQKMRSARSAGFSPRGRYRGQTQSQYLAIERGDKKDEGVAEAHSAADSSRATVSGNSGMGQAQSQSMYDPSCDDCIGKNDIDAANLQRVPGQVITGTTNYGNGPIRGWGNQGNTPGQSGIVTAPGHTSGDVRPPNSLNQNELTGMHAGTPGFNTNDPRGSSGFQPGNQLGARGPPVQGQPGLGPGVEYGPNGINAARPGGQYGPGGQGEKIPGSPAISIQRPGSPSGPQPGGAYGNTGGQYRPNGQNIPGGQYRPGETGASIPQGQYNPNVMGERNPGTNYYPGGSMIQRPGAQYAPSNSGGYGPGGQYDPGGSATQGSGNNYGPSIAGGHKPGGQYGQEGSGTQMQGRPGQGPNEQYNPNEAGVRGPSGQYDSNGAGWQKPFGPSEIPGSSIGRPYGPDATGTQGPQGQNGVNVGPINTGIGEPGSNGQYIPGGQVGSGGANPLQTGFGDRTGTYPVGFKWPATSGPFVGPDGLNYVCCVVQPNGGGAPLSIPGSSGQGTSGNFVPGEINGQYGPNGYKVPGTGGYPGVADNKINGFYGPNGEGNAGGQSIGGSSGKPYDPQSVGRPTGPGYANNPVQYGPDMVRNVPPSIQYGPGLPGVRGPGGFIPGTAGNGNIGGAYLPGTVGGTDLGGQYGPGTAGVGSNSKYPPIVSGGNGPYGPSATGGQYGPGITNAPGLSGQYNPGSSLRNVPGGQYSPNGIGGSGSGPYNSLQTGSPGATVNGVQNPISGVTGGQGPSGQYGPIGTGSSNPGGVYDHTATGGIPQEQYGPRVIDHVQGSTYTPGQPGSSEQYAPNVIAGNGSGGHRASEVDGGQYGVPVNNFGSNGQYVPGGTTGDQYAPGKSGPGGMDGRYRPGSPNGLSINGPYGPDSAGQGSTGGQYSPNNMGPGPLNGGQYIPTGGQYGNGGPGGSNLGSSEGQNSAGQYGPNSGGGAYGPSSSGGQYGPKSVGGQYAPNSVEGQYGPNSAGGHYGPNSAGGQYRPNSAGGQYGPNSLGGQYGPNSAGGQYGPNSAGGQYGPNSAGGQYGPNTSGQNGPNSVGGQYGPNSAGGHIPNGQYGPGGTISQPGGGIKGPENQMGGDNSQIPPQNVIDPNSMADGDDSQAEASVSQAVNGTVASASSKGGNDKERAQTHVTGTYTGSGSFAAQAAITGDNKAANSEVSGDKKGASSTAQGSGRNNKSQANVKLGSESGAVLTGSQSEGVLHSSNSQVQGSVKGGMADAQARGPGSTSSQAQIGFTPYKEGDKNHEAQKTPFVGGGVASAQSNGRTGMSQSQLHGTFKYGISYNGAAQSGASLDKDAVFPNRLSFEKIDVFDESNKNINVDEINIENTEHTEDITIAPDIGTSTEAPFEAPVEKDIDKDENINNFEETYDSHSHADHHTTSDPPLSTTRAPPVESRRSFKSSYGTNNGDYEYSTDKEENLPEDYDVDDGYSTDGNDQLEGDQGYINPNYNEFSGDSDATHQAILNSRGKGLEVRQTTGGNTQHILLGSLADQDAEITQRRSERPDESKVYQPGERVPGTGGYTIPIGFTGSVKSVASKDSTYVVGSDKSPSQAQTVSLTPGNGKIKYKYPSYGKSVNPNNLRSLYNPRNEDSNRYVSVSKSVTRDLDSENNIRKQYSHTYYTKSSSCGYFTFTCTMVSSAEGKKRVCKPKIPQNPDGTPIRC